MSWSSTARQWRRKFRSLASICRPRSAASPCPCSSGKDSRRGNRCQPAGARCAYHRLQQRVLRRGAQLRRLHPRLPRGAAPPGAARGHLVPRPEGDAFARAGAGDRPRLSRACRSCRRRLGARESREVALMNSKVGRWTLAVLAHVALVIAWYLFVRLGNVPKFVMPSPGATIDALLTPNYGWWTNIAVTGTEIFGGYLLALVIGVALALVFTWSKALEALFMPL